MKSIELLMTQIKMINEEMDIMKKDIKYVEERIDRMLSVHAKLFEMCGNKNVVVTQKSQQKF